MFPCQAARAYRIPAECGNQRTMSGKSVIRMTSPSVAMKNGATPRKIVFSGTSGATFARDRPAGVQDERMSSIESVKSARSDSAARSVSAGRGGGAALISWPTTPGDSRPMASRSLFASIGLVT